MEFGLVKPLHEPEMDTTAWEEDEFYVELRRQILLLTADEDEDGFLDVGGYHRAFDGLEKRNLGSNARPLSEDIGQVRKIHSGKVPTSQVDQARNVNGTGVFIPTIYPARRRGRPGRNNQRRGTYKQVGRTHDSSFTAGLKSSSVKCQLRRQESAFPSTVQ